MHIYTLKYYRTMELVKFLLTWLNFINIINIMLKKGSQI